MAADFDEAKHPRAGKGEDNGGQFVAGSGGGGAPSSSSEAKPKAASKPKAATPPRKPTAAKPQRPVKPTGSSADQGLSSATPETIGAHPDLPRAARDALGAVDTDTIHADAIAEFFDRGTTGRSWEQARTDAMENVRSAVIDEIAGVHFDAQMSDEMSEAIQNSPAFARSMRSAERAFEDYMTDQAEPPSWAIDEMDQAGRAAFREQAQHYNIDELSGEVGYDWYNSYDRPLTRGERDAFESAYSEEYDTAVEEADAEAADALPNDEPSEIDPALVPDKHRDKERPETPADRSLDGAERLKGDDWLAAAANQGAKTRWAKTQIVNDVFPDGAPDLERLASVWASDTHTIEINTVDTRTEDDGGSAVVLSGEIVDDTATKIGEITRSFIRHPDGSLEVHHDYFRIDRSSKLGQGGGAAMMGQALEAYEQLGVDKVTVQAAWIGKYTWASFGYDWSASEADSKQDELERFLREHNVANADRIARAASRHAYDVARLDIPGVTHQFTRQQMMNISGTTDAPPTTPDPMPIGKAFLMQCDGWEGTITLSDKASGSYQHAAKRLKLKGSVASPAAAPPPAVHGPDEQLKLPGMKKLSRRATGRRILDAMQPPRQPAPDSMADMMEAEADAANAADAFPLDGLEDVPPEAVPTEAEKPSALEPPPKPPTSRVVIPAMRPEPGEAMEAFAVRVADALRSAAKSAKPKKGKPAGVSSEAKSRDPSNGDKPTVSGPPPKPQPGVPGSDLQEEFREYAGNKPVQRPV